MAIPVRRLHRASAAFALVAAVAAGLFVNATNTAPASEDCLGRRSWAAGTVDLCDGTLVYRDYLYDDYGADDPAVAQESTLATAGLSRTAGDARYDPANVNSADLVDLQLRVDGDEVHVTAELAALFNPDSTILAIAIDTDGNEATGGGPWGDLVAVPSSGAKLHSTGWDAIHYFSVGDPAANTIAGTFPRPAGHVWRVQAVTAKQDKTVMNVAFRGTDEATVVGAWWDDKQAAALAAGDISAFGHTVQVADLASGATRRAALPTGFHQRVYTSAYTLSPGEGVDYAGRPGRHGATGGLCEQEFNFLGKYQPYGVFVPEGPGPHGMQLALHGCNANHSGLVDQPGLQQQMGTDLNRIVVTPLGRGPIGFYSDISERDVLDVMADVEAAYRVDPDRVFGGGYSMGGYGAFRLAQLYPQRFAGYVTWVGFTGDCTGTRPGQCVSGAVGNAFDFTGNTRHVPGVLIYAGRDELVTAKSAAGIQKALQQTGSPFAFHMHPTADHGTFLARDQWPHSEATKGLTRVTRPAQVVYRLDPSLDFPEYGLKHDRAYWVSEIAAAAPGFADVDLTTFACGGTGPGSTPLARRRALEGALHNVSSLRVDAADACVDRTSLTYKLATDGPVTLSLSDGRHLVLPAAGVHQGVLGATPAG